VNVVAAMVAGVRWPAGYAVVLGHALALLAKDFVRVKVLAKPFKAGGIIRISLSEASACEAIFLGPVDD